MKNLRSRYSKSETSTYGSLLRVSLSRIELLSKIWFHPTEIAVEEDLLKICRIHDKIKLILLERSGENFGCTDYLDACYVREVFVSEQTTSEPDWETEEISIIAMEGGPQPANISERTWTKIQNIKHALNYLRGTEIPVFLTVDLVQSIHKIVGSSIIESAGNYRTAPAAAAGTHVVYLAP